MKLKGTIRCCMLLIGLSGFCLADLTAGENWPRFRGPNGTGVSAEQSIPAEWTKENVRWSVDLPGEGNSSPIIWGQRVFITSADVESGQRYLQCFDSGSGKLLWQREFPLSKYKKHNNNSFASSTPCCDAERVYALWQSSTDGCTLQAFSHEGEPQWQVDLGEFKGGHGPAVSPIVYQDLVIVANDQDGDSSLLAFAAKSGEQRWVLPRDSDRTQYSTPCVFQMAGRDPELIFTDMHHGITAVNPETGERNWEVSVFGTFKQRAIASPVVTGDLVIGLSGFTTAEKNAVAVRPDSAEPKTMASEKWRVSRSVPHLPTPLVYQDRMYLWTDRGGIVTCVDVADGSEIWQKRIGGNFSGSPVCVNGKIYCADDDGKVYVIAAQDKYELLGKSELGHPTRATPAVGAGAMFWRTDSNLICISGK